MDSLYYDLNIPFQSEADLRLIIAKAFECNIFINEKNVNFWHWYNSFELCTSIRENTHYNYFYSREFTLVYITMRLYIQFVKLKVII